MDFKTVQNYIHKKLSSHDQTKINRLRKENSEIELLLDLVDSCQDIRNLVRPKQALSLSDDQIELLIIRLLSHNIHKKDAATFLTGLDDPLFFEKVTTVLQIASTPESNFVDEAPEIRFQTTEEIYAMLKSHTSPKVQGRPFSVRMLEWAQHRQFGWKRVGLPITAFAAFVIAIILPLQFRQSSNIVYDKYFNNPSSDLRLQSSLTILQSTRSFSSTDSLGLKNSLVTHYKNAFADYVMGDYKAALDKLSILKKEIMALDESEKNSYLKSEFNFYSGICHLKLAGTRGQHKHHLHTAIDELGSSLEIANTLDFSHNGKVSFFLALAYQMNGDQDQVQKILAEYPVDEKYFDDAEQLKSKN